jgi:PAS domain S-box-containing protein
MRESDASPASETILSSRAARLWTLAAFLTGAAVALGLYFPLLRHERAEVLELWEARLSALADDRVASIRSHLQERAADVRTLADLPRTRDMLLTAGEGTPENDDSVRRRYEDHLSNVRTNYGYEAVYLFGSDLRMRACSDGAPSLDEVCLQELRQTLAVGADRFVDLHEDSAGHFTFSHHAVVGPPGELSGVAVAISDPTRWLYPLLARQPLPSDTAEILIGAVRDGRIAFLSPLRFESRTPPSYPVATPARTLALKSALEGRAQFGAFSDYRGRPVLAATHHIEGTPWGLVAKVDEAEAYGRLGSWRLGYAAISLLCVLGATLFVYGLLRRHRHAYFEALAIQEDRYRALSEQSRDVFLLARPDGAIVEANAAAVRAYGYSREELLRKNLRDLRAPSERASLPAAVSAAARSGGSRHESVHLSRTGVEFPVEISAQPIRIGKETLLAGVVRDISERKAAERRILKLNRLYRTLSEANQALVRAGTRQDLLDVTCRILVEHGSFLRACIVLSDETGTGRRMEGCHPAEPLPGCSDEGLPGPLPTQASVTRDGDLQRSFLPLVVGGRIEGVLCVASSDPAAFDPEEMGLLQELAGDLGFALDVHRTRERRDMAEKAIEEKEARLRSLVENMNTCVAVYEAVDDGADFLVLDLNPAAERSTRARMEEVEGRRVTEVFPGIRDMGLLQVFRRVYASGTPERHPVSFYRDERLALWADNYVFRLPSGQVVAVFEDITERKQAEEALSESEERLRLALEATQQGLYDLNVQTGECAVTPEYARMLGYDPETFVETNQAWIERLHPDDLEPVAEVYRKSVAGDIPVYRVEYRQRCADGSWKWILSLGKIVGFDAEGRPLRMLGTHTDITERKNAEARQRFYLEALNSSLDEIFVFNTETLRFEFASQGALRNLGYDLDALRRMTPVDIKPDFTPETFREALRPLLAGEVGRLHFETLHRRADGTTYPVEVHVQLFDRGDRRVFVAFILDLTERREAEAALRESEEKYRRLHESMIDAFAQTDMEGNLREWNAAFQSMLGYNDEELTRLTYTQFTPPEWHDFEAAIVRDQILPAGYSGVYEKEYVRKDGTRLPVELRTFLLRDGRGRPAAMWAIVRDITDRKRAEAALRESEEKYRTVLQNMMEGYYEVDLAGNLTFFNDAMCTLFGYTRAELQGMNNRQYTDEKNAKALYEAFNAVYRTGVPTRGFGWEVIRKNGTVRTIEASVSLRRDDSGNAVGFKGLIRDVTEERRAAEALRRSEERFRTLFENSPVGMYRTTPDGRILEANPKIIRLLGFETFEELSTRNLEEGGFEPSYPRETFKAQIEKSGEVRGLESAWRRQDGEVLHIREHARAVRGASGEVLYYDGVIEDVTAEHRAEEARRLLSTAIEQGHETVVITDREGTILYVNPAFERITGYSREEAVGQNPRILKSGVHDEAFYRDLWDTLLAGRVWTGRLTNRRRNGTLFLEHSVISPVKDEQGHIVAFVAAKRDITQEVELEERLQRAKSLETVGMVAGGMAHEVRNPLFAISTLTSALDKKFGANEEIRPYIGFIQEHVQRLTHLMNDLLALGRPVGKEQFVPCDLCGLGEGVRDILAKEDPGRASRLDLDCTAGDAQVLGQADKIAQALLNLVQNALHFSEPEGRVLLQTRREGSWGVVRVVDRGSGIPPDFLPRLFQPFASRRQGGTGLGLALVRKFVEAHGGSVEGANNEPGPGATFTVRLPLWNEGG